MTSEQLLQLEQTIRSEADGILDGKGLRTLLQRYGDVHLTGSYRLGLMTWRDLDVLVRAPTVSIPDFFHLGSEVAQILSPTKMHFRNERIAKTSGLPEGLYWGVYLGNERAGAWKLDIWAVSRKHCEGTEQYCQNILDRLTPESSLTVLRIKSGCWTQHGYRREYASDDIYEAVLENAVEDLDQFEEYLAETKGCRLDGSSAST